MKKTSRVTLDSLDLVASRLLVFEPARTQTAGQSLHIKQAVIYLWTNAPSHKQASKQASQSKRQKRNPSFDIAKQTECFSLSIWQTADSLYQSTKEKEYHTRTGKKAMQIRPCFFAETVCQKPFPLSNRSHNDLWPSLLPLCTPLEVLFIQRIHHHENGLWAEAEGSLLPCGLDHIGTLVRSGQTMKNEKSLLFFQSVFLHPTKTKYTKKSSMAESSGKTTHLLTWTSFRSFSPSGHFVGSWALRRFDSKKVPDVLFKSIK